MILQFNVGDKCNLNCYYCKSERNRSFCITDKLDEIKDKLHQLRDNNKLSIAITGQEPTLSMDRVRKVISVFEERAEKQPNFYLLTNGTKIDRELVDYVNKHNVFVTVSFDGHNGYKEYDVLTDKKLLLLGIKKLKFVGLLTDRSYPMDIFYPLEQFDKKYYALHDRHITVTLENLLPLEGSYNDCISDFTRIKKEMALVKKQAQAYVNGNNDKFIYYEYMARVLERKNIDNNAHYCGICKDYFNVDMEGNITLCYRRDIILGTVYDDFADISKRAYEIFSQNYTDKCLNCKVFRFCHRGCPMIPKDIKATHCKYAHAMYGEFLNA